MSWEERNHARNAWVRHRLAKLAMLCTKQVLGKTSWSKHRLNQKAYPRIVASPCGCHIVARQCASPR